MKTSLIFSISLILTSSSHAVTLTSPKSVGVSTVRSGVFVAPRPITLRHTNALPLNAPRSTVLGISALPQVLPLVLSGAAPVAGLPMTDPAELPGEAGLAAPTPVDQTILALTAADEEGRLESELPVIYDAALRGGDVESAVAGSAGSPAMTLKASQKPASSRNDPEAVRTEYSNFLSRLGFRNYSAEIDDVLADKRQTPSQKEVLEFNRERYRVVNAARDLAAEVMAGLAEQKFSKTSLNNATELAARLIALQPLDPPSTIPPEIAAKDKDGIVEWLSAVTVQKLGTQLAQVVSDAVKTVVSPAEIKRYTKDMRDGGQDAAATKEFARRVIKIKGYVESQLVSSYTDAELGQTRFAGRALAAALVRFSRKQDRPEIEQALSRKVRERGLYLENFVGDTLIVHDIHQPTRAIKMKIHTGDILGERSGGREASEITFAVRPPWRLWFKAWRANLAGRYLGLWANPKSAPRFVEGQRLRNKLKLLLWEFKKWLAKRPFMEKGYSHVGMASVEEADGVAMAWALDNYPNAGEGGIRKMGITEQFAQNGPYLRFGVARWDAEKVWEAFAKQSSENGYRKKVYESEGGSWPSRISAEDFKRLQALPKSRASELLAEMNRRAVEVLEEMLKSDGVGFAYGFTNELWKAYCSATMIIAHRMGSQFEMQTYPDMWHPVVLLMKHLGIGGAKDQNTEGRIIWPGSFFIDPKVARHEMARFPPFTEVGRLPDPNTMPAYVEADPALTASLIALTQLSQEGTIEPDGGVIDRALRTHLDSRTDKNRNKSGYRSGASHSSGYSAGLDALLGEGDDD